MIDWNVLDETSLSGSVWPSPVGPFWVVHSSTALVLSEFGQSWPNSVMGRPVLDRPMPDWIERILDQTFRGRAVECWPAADLGFTALERDLLSRASDIPFGTTCSYGTLASWAGYPRRARAAGRAMRRSPLAYLIPTHRVIRADGTAAECQRDPLNEVLRRYEAIALPGRSGIMGTIR